MYCVSPPCKLSVGATLCDALSALDANGVIRSNSDAVSIRQKNTDGFSHCVSAVIQSVNNGLATVRVGDILIDEIQLPGDIVVGDTVEFTVSRLDAFA